MFQKLNWLTKKSRLNYKQSFYYHKLLSSIFHRELLILGLSHVHFILFLVNFMFLACCFYRVVIFALAPAQCSRNSQNVASEASLEFLYTHAHIKHKQVQTFNKVRRDKKILKSLFFLFFFPFFAKKTMLDIFFL